MSEPIRPASYPILGESDVSLTLVSGSDELTARHQLLHKLGIIDTAHDDRFDRIARVAKRALDVPIALVRLVDDESHWLGNALAQVSERGGSDTPSIDGQINDVAQSTNGAFIIEDAAYDERFKDSPFVTGDPYIRFYAECPIVAGDGSNLGTLCVIDHKPRRASLADLELLQDMAALVERELAAVYLASVDELTGVANRRGFFTMANQYMQISLRQHVPMSLVFLDLNEFKKINDEFGHAEGDAALRAFAAIIKSSMRGSDFVSRFGGDEFIVLLSDALPATVQAFIERAMLQVDDYNQTEDRGYKIEFSAGVVSFDPEVHASIETLLDEGDKLMYQNKRHNKSRSQ